MNGGNVNNNLDGKGNVTAVLDGGGQVVAAYRYDEFGNLMAESGTLAQPYQFSTKRYFEGIGQYYYGYRNYSPSCGRWTTRDPLGEEGGINLYGFVENDPVNREDPYGLLGLDTVLKLAQKLAEIARKKIGKTIGNKMTEFDSAIPEEEDTDNDGIPNFRDPDSPYYYKPKLATCH